MSRWGRRVCCACGRDLLQEQFSYNQWFNRDVGESRCKLCVEEGNPRDNGGFNTARTNQSVKDIIVDLNDIVARGTFRLCCYGTYRGGPRHGQRCVVKYYKNEYKHLGERDHVAANEKALHLITSWNQSGFVNTHFRLNMPEIWTINGQSSCLVEPYIKNYSKFNSNNGWTCDRTNANALMIQALSHYTYHVSSGQFVLCDLQGGCYRDGVYLSDPVILSRTPGRYGATDLGPAGMSTFFHHHRCNRYCLNEWTQPRDQHCYHQRSIHTSVDQKYRENHPQQRSNNHSLFYDESESDSDEEVYVFSSDVVPGVFRRPIYLVM